MGAGLDRAFDADGAHDGNALRRSASVLQEGEQQVKIEPGGTLRELCQRAIDTRDGSLIPPQGGFFFGSTEIDEYYWQDLKETIEILDALDLDSKDYNVDYEYHSSW